MLKDKGIRQSISRNVNCLDNACEENFFSLLKTELLYLQEFDSIEHFISELKTYIVWYNTKRIKLKLDGMSPVEYRLAQRCIMQQSVQAYHLVALHGFV